MKNYIIMMTFATILIIYSIVHACASSDAKGQLFTASICRTPGCLKAAESILKNMNKSHKPCNNFYLFACGKFVKGANVPKGQGYVDSVSKMTHEIQKTLNVGMKQKISQDELRAFKLLRSYYRICLNADHTGKIYRDQITEIMSEFGGWPVLAGKSWDESKFNWKDLIYRARKLGLTNAMNSLIYFNVDASNGKKSSFIRFDPAVTAIDKNDLKKGWEAKEVGDYYNRMVDVAISFGADEAQAQMELKKSLEFEMNLAKIPEFENHLYNVQHSNKTIIKFPWHEYLKEFFPPNDSVNPNINIFFNAKTFDSTLNLIKNSEKRTVANYLIWRVTMELVDFVNYRISKAEDYFITPVGTGNKFWKNCVNYVTENMPLSSGAFYVRKYFKKALKADVLEMTTNLSKTLKKILFEVSWMSNSTKTTAQRKLESMKIHAAYPDEFLDDQKLDHYFSSLPNPTNNFLNDHLALMRFNYENKLKYFTKHSNENDWVNHVSSATVDVMYHNENNAIDIFAGFLQEAFLAHDKPHYLNYGGIGHVIAHEIFHGFDRYGSKFDENGNRKNWWDSKTISEYENRTRCFVEQYNKYKASRRKIPLNGTYTLEENIADVSGFKVAYDAYVEWEEGNGEELGLPGLPYTPRQLFWISAANTACTRFRRKGWDMFLKDKRSPAPFRIIGSFSNMREFARDFECPVGSRMNPKKKCSLW